jgi:PAS domain S-box-containing protein
MATSSGSGGELRRENAELRRRLDDAEAIVHAIRRHEVDAFVVEQDGKEGILVLEGVAQPYRLLVERMQQGAAVLTADGTITYANRCIAEFLAQPSTSVTGTKFLTHVAPAYHDRFVDLLHRATDDAEGDIAIVRSDGTEFSALVTIAPILDLNGSLCVIVTDMTQHKQYAVERERLIKEQAARAAAEHIADQLRIADRRKDEFLAMLGHELRNPLAAVRYGLDVLNRVGRDDPRGDQAKAMIGRQVESIIRLVDDLLVAARLGRGKIELRLEAVSLGPVVARALESCRACIEQRAHRLEVQLPEETVTVQADIVRLVQVITNLINNAAKFTPPGGHIQIRVERDSASQQAMVRVRDNGIGISPEMMPRVFDLFAQADEVHSEAGLGIGLTLARRIVEMHGGRLDGASGGLGQGSEFCIRLPMVDALNEAR